VKNVDTVTLRCNNVGCRIETFVGTLMLPLSSCPVCQKTGIQ
jgi:hypothetical protein